MDDVSDHEMSGHEFSDDESTENGFGDDDLPQFDPSMVNMEEIKEGMVRMVCCIERFLPRSVECPVFQKFIGALNPCIQLEDFETVKQGCLKYYEEERIKTEQMLRNRDGQISLTVETLRCYQSFDVYACIRAHFIDDNWNHKGWVLRFQKIFDDCVLLGAVQKCINSWGIAGKILTVTFQGYHYDPDFFDEEIRSYIQSHKQPELDGQLLHGYCCANLFREMADAAFGGIDAIFRKLKCFISFPMVDQSWSVINFCLKEALDLKSMGEITREIVGDKDWLSDEEWKKVEQVYDLVYKLISAAKLIFERKYATGSTFLVGLNDLHESLKTAASSSCSFTNATAQKMLLKLDKYWNNMFLVLAIAAVMDPRCKMVYIVFLSSKSEYPQLPTVLETVRSLYDKYATTNAANVGQGNSGTGSNEVEDSGTEEDEYNNNNNVNPLSSHLQDFQEFVHTTNQAPPKSDLDLYLEEPVISWDDNFDLLAWWRTQSPKYPTLSKMARDILSIQFSVLKSDDVYNNEERAVDEDLLAEGPVLLNALMCTRSWYQKKAKK